MIVYKEKRVLKSSIMKDNQSKVSKEAVLDSKALRIQKQISLLNWIGWSGGYGKRSKKKKR